MVEQASNWDWEGLNGATCYQDVYQPGPICDANNLVDSELQGELFMSCMAFLII